MMSGAFQYPLLLHKGQIWVSHIKHNVFRESLSLISPFYIHQVHSQFILMYFAWEPWKSKYPLNCGINFSYQIKNNFRSDFLLENIWNPRIWPLREPMGLGTHSCLSAGRKLASSAFFNCGFPPKEFTHTYFWAWWGQDPKPSVEGSVKSESVTRLTRENQDTMV